MCLTAVESTMRRAGNPHRDAFVLHRITFPRLATPQRASTGTLRDHLGVVLPAALSNTLWLNCAFMGVATSWKARLSDHAPLGGHRASFEDSSQPGRA